MWTEVASRCEHPVAMALACYLVQEGCSLEKRNNKGSTPLDLVAATPMVDLLTQYVTTRR